MLKKIMATVLAGALALSLAVPVFAIPDAGTVGASSDVTATNSSSDKLEVSVDAKANIPTLKLQIAGKPGIVLNPYGLKAHIDDRLAAGGGTTGTGTAGIGDKGTQIVGAPISIKNESGVPVAVGASFTTTAQGISFAALPTNIKDTETKKMVFLALSAGETLSDAQGRSDFAKGNFLGSLVATSGTASQPNLWSIENGKTNYFTFVGAMTKSPSEAWAESDDFQIALTMNFRLSMPDTAS